MSTPGHRVKDGLVTNIKRDLPEVDIQACQSTAGGPTIQSSRGGTLSPADPALAMAMASAASRLHNDILLDIFHIIVQVTFACDNTSGNGTAGSLLILPISHVCRSWRILTLASPCLWSFLQITATTHIDMLDAFLSRSQAVILSIRFFGWKVNEELFEMARTLSEKHMDRMGSLCIKDLWTQDTVKILAFFEDKHAPNLYALTVEAGPNGDVVPLSGGCMPVLRRLRMKMVILRWLPLKDMVVLEIVGEAYTPAKEDLLWTLRHSPALEELHLSLGEESPQDAVTSSLHDDVVHLPRLHNLQLGSFKAMTMSCSFISFGLPYIRVGKRVPVRATARACVSRRHLPLHS